jgi:hypothetical protein
MIEDPGSCASWWDAELRQELRQGSVRTVGKVRKALSTRSVAIIGLCLGLTGCKNVATTWSQQQPSPDGRWLATARTQQWSGPGTAYVATTVDLKDVQASSASNDVLLFTDQSPIIRLTMRSLTAPIFR